jgi:hypothetical protein
MLTIEKVMILVSLILIGNLLQSLLPWLAPRVEGPVLCRWLISICFQGSIILCLLCWHDAVVLVVTVGQDMVHNQVQAEFGEFTHSDQCVAL